MHYKYWLILFAFLCCSYTNAWTQIKKDSITISKNHLKSILKITFSNNLGFIWEQRLNPVSSLSIFGGYSLGRQSNDYTDRSAPIISSPDLYADYRYYYNFQKRLDHQKKTRNNAGEFFFGRLESVFAVPGKNNFSLLGIEGWGCQRTFSKSWIIGFQTGIIEHAFYDKPVTGGFNYIKLEPMLTITVSGVF